MKRSTANAIKLLLRLDDTVTPQMRLSINALMCGRGEANSLDPTQDMSVADAADYLGVCRATVWRMCKSGKVACVRRGKKYFVKAAVVAALKGEAA